MTISLALIDRLNKSLARFIPSCNRTDFRIGRFGRSCLGWHAAGTLAGVILLASLTKTRQYCDADKILQKATTINTYIFFEEVGQKVVIYNVIAISFCPLLTSLRGFRAEDA